MSLSLLLEAWIVMVVWFADIQAFHHLSSARFSASHCTHGLGGLAHMSFCWCLDDALEASVAEPADLPCWWRGGILLQLACIRLE